MKSFFKLPSSQSSDLWGTVWAPTLRAAVISREARAAVEDIVESEATGAEGDSTYYSSRK